MEPINSKIAIFFESFSLSGAILFFLAIFTILGIIMSWQGNPAGEKVFTASFSAFTAFVTGKSLGQNNKTDKQ